jgi:O-antigen ligase
MKLRADWILVAVIVSYTVFGTASFDWGSSRYSLYQLFLPAAAFVVACASLTAKFPGRPRATASPIAVWMAPLLAVFFFSASRSVDPAEGYTTALRYAGNFTLALTAATAVRRPEQLRRILVVLVGVAAGSAALGLLQATVSLDLTVPCLVFRDCTETPYSPVGFGSLEYKFGNGLLVGILPGLALALTSPPEDPERRRLFFLVGLSLAGLAISRGGSSILGVLLGASYLVLRIQAPSIRTLLAGGVATAVLAAAASPAFVDWAVNAVTSYRNLQSRLLVYRAGLEMLAADPLLGIGLGSFGAVAPDLLLRLGPRLLDTAPHNVFFGILVENGILGLGLYTGLLAAALRASSPQPFASRLPLCRREWGLALAVRATWIGYLADGFFHNYFLDNHLWLLVGLSASVAGLAARSARPVSREATEGIAAKETPAEARA